MKNRFFFAIVLFAALAVGCEKTPSSPDDPQQSSGYLVLNNGNWGQNDSNVCIYDPETKLVSKSAFSAANGQLLGDLGQDILRAGDRIYIAMNGSQTVFVTDSDLKLLKAVTVSQDGVNLAPRCLTAGGGKVYVTYYDGYLGEIDPDTFAVRITPVGPNPDGCAYLDGKVYTANSGGYLYPVYDNTVSVVDCASFKEVSKITVNSNPAFVKASGNKVYVSSYGDFAASQPMVQCIDTATGKVTDLPYEAPLSIDVCGDKLYVLCVSHDASWNTLPGSVYVHDAAKNIPLGSFVTDGTELKDAYSISASNSFIFVGCSDYVTTGNIFVFDSLTGKLYDKFDSEGMNPQRVI